MVTSETQRALKLWAAATLRCAELAGWKSWGCQSLARAACGLGQASSQLLLGRQRAVPPRMAAKQRLPSLALRVLEEALGMGLTTARDTAEAVAAEGAYYLERILKCRRGLQALPLVTGWGRGRGLPTGGALWGLWLPSRTRRHLDLMVESPAPCSPDSYPLNFSPFRSVRLPHSCWKNLQESGT